MTIDPEASCFNCINFLVSFVKILNFYRNFTALKIYGN